MIATTSLGYWLLLKLIDAVGNIARFVVELVKNSKGKTESYAVLEELGGVLGGVEDIIYMLNDPLLYEELSEEIDKLKTQLIT
jgi:hypothetical protein